MNSTIRPVVRGVYDLQKLRIQTGLRLVATFKAKLGQAPGERETELDTEAKQILRDLRVSYVRITDAIANQKQKFSPDGLIDSFTEFALVAQYMSLDKMETEQFHYLGKLLNGIPIYDTFLEKVKGVGPAMAGVIISEIDISKAKYVSSLWKLAGLDVAPDGKGRSRKQEHLVQREYTTREGEKKERNSITFNPFLKTKLVGVLGASFLRSKSPYREAYDNYKNRLENHPAHKEKTKAHKHNMATRYMVKMFLRDLYIAWRPLEGLEVWPDYATAKLGLQHDSGREPERKVVNGG